MVRWDYSNDDEKILIYDLRQTYAELISALLKQIMIARQQKNYTQWFDLLDDLHTEINQKLNNEERERYKSFRSHTVKTIEKYPQAYLGKTNDSQQNNEIKFALKHLEMFLKRLMEKHKMFGAKEEAELI